MSAPMSYTPQPAATATATLTPRATRGPTCIYLHRRLTSLRIYIAGRNYIRINTYMPHYIYNHVRAHRHTPIHHSPAPASLRRAGVLSIPHL